MALEPITRQEQIIAGKELEPITRMEKFLKEYGGGSGGGAISWNDLTDKPFGEEVTEGVVLEETEFDFTYEGEAEITEAVSLTIGKNYTVKFGNDDFKCTATEIDYDGISVTILGDANIAFTGRYNGNEPFCIMVLPEEMAVALGGYGLVFATIVTPITISITGEVKTVKTIDPKYIKDMYYEETSIVEVLPETTYVSDPDVNHGEVVGAVIGLEAGKPYIVNWNGTEYTCVGVPIVGADFVALGNVGAIDGEAENTGEPFVIADAPGLGVMRILPLDGLTSVTVSVFEVSATVKTIDPKYLPDTVATKADLEAARPYVILNSSTEGSTKQFKITVDDSGTISATEV